MRHPAAPQGPPACVVLDLAVSSPFTHSTCLCPASTELRATAKLPLKRSSFFRMQDLCGLFPSFYQ